MIFNEISPDNNLIFALVLYTDIGELQHTVSWQLGFYVNMAQWGKMATLVWGKTAMVAVLPHILFF